MTEFQGVLGLSQIKHIDEWILRRNEIANLETDDLENKLKDFFKKYDPKFKDKEENQEDI